MGVMENSSHTDSQVLGSSCLLSLSSEPPDIRNWFSSYAYESPELDSNDNVGDCMSKEREIEEDELTANENNGASVENFGEFRNVRKIDEDEAAEELPRTWIPLKCTPIKDDRGSQHLGMNQDSWCSHSLLSEPPDVGNWFSSYAYESPALNSSQEFGYGESENTEFIAEERNNEIEETLESDRKTRNGREGTIGEEVHFKAFVRCNGNAGDNGQEKQPLDEIHGRLWKNDPSSQQHLFSERTWKQNPKEKNLGTEGISPIKDVQTSSLTAEGSQCKLRENGSLPPHINGSSNDDDKKSTIPTNSIHGMDHKQESSQTEVQSQLDCSSAGNHVPSVLTNGQSKLTNLSNNKENIEKRVSENGFVTASKREFSGATYKRSVGRPENYNKETGCAAALPRRKALSDNTNIEHSNMVEVIGKWSCPQNSKPNLGPPLKQLRLERWVRKG